MVTVSKLKAYMKEKGMRASKELAAALDVELKKLLDQASQRALMDRRKTVKPEDVVS